MALKSLSKGEAVPVTDLTVIKILGGGKAVVAESSKAVAILLYPSEQVLKDGEGIKIIKAKMESNDPLCIKPDSRFKIQRSLPKDIKIKEDVLKQLVEQASRMESDKDGSLGPTFAEIDQMTLGDDGLFPQEVHVMLITQSKICSGPYGSYQIANCKDYRNVKTTMAIYGHMAQWYKKHQLQY